MGSRLLTVMPAGALLIIASPCAAQDAPPLATRVTWPLVDFVVTGDSNSVSLIVSPNLRADTSTRDIALVVEAHAWRRWLATASRAVDSIMQLRRGDRAPFPPLALAANGNRAAIGISLDGRGPRNAPFRLAMATSGRPPAGFAVYASAEQLRALFTSIAERSRMQGPDTWTRDSVRTAGELDVQPRWLMEPPMFWPPEEHGTGREARVLAQFVVDSTGAVRPGSFQVLLSDGTAFTAATRDAVYRTRFAPGRVGGRPVSALVRHWFRYQQYR